MAFKLNETLVIQSIDHYGIKAGKLSIGVVTEVSEAEKDWIGMDLVDRSYTHVALEPDAGWQCQVVCKDIDGTVFPDDIEKVYVIQGDSWVRFVVVDGEGKTYGFPAPSYGHSLLCLAIDLNERMSRGDVQACLEFLLAGSITEAELVKDGICVYQKPVKAVEQDMTRERNTVVLKCSGDSGAQLIGAAVGPMYAIGVGGEDEGRGMFLTVDQATDLVDSLVQFIEEAE